VRTVVGDPRLDTVVRVGCRGTVDRILDIDGDRRRDPRRNLQGNHGDLRPIGECRRGRAAEVINDHFTDVGIGLDDPERVVPFGHDIGGSHVGPQSKDIFCTEVVKSLVFCISSICGGITGIKGIEGGPIGRRIGKSGITQGFPALHC